MKQIVFCVRGSSDCPFQYQDISRNGPDCGVDRMLKAHKHPGKNTPCVGVEHDSCPLNTADEVLVKRMHYDTHINGGM